jgi:hypothetical protein
MFTQLSECVILDHYLVPLRGFSLRHELRGGSLFSDRSLLRAGEAPHRRTRDAPFSSTSQLLAESATKGIGQAAEVSRSLDDLIPSPEPSAREDVGGRIDLSAAYEISEARFRLIKELGGLPGRESLVVHPSVARDEERLDPFEARSPSCDGGDDPGENGTPTGSGISSSDSWRTVGLSVDHVETR